MLERYSTGCKDEEEGFLEMVEQNIAKDGITIAQIFYYTGGGLAGLAVAVKTVMIILKRLKNKKNV
jgi:hypothetical protein